MVALCGLVVACGDGRIFIDVDLRSFLRADDVAGGYAFPVLPVPVTVRQVKIVAPTVIRLVEGLGSITQVEEGRIGVVAAVRNRKGTAGVRMLLYLAADSTSVAARSVPPDTLAGTFSTLPPDTLAGTIELTARERALFASDHLWVRIDMEADLPAGAPGDSLAGTYEIRSLLARLRTREDLF